MVRRARTPSPRRLATQGGDPWLPHDPKDPTKAETHRIYRFNPLDRVKPLTEVTSKAFPGNSNDGFEDVVMKHSQRIWWTEAYSGDVWEYNGALPPPTRV